MDVLGKAHPVYNLLPWEVKHAERLGNSATKFVKEKYGYSWDKEQELAKQANALVGAKGEIAFIQMLKEEYQENVDWTADGKDYAEYYDFELKNSRLGKVDIKTAIKVPKRPLPTSVNFVLGTRLVSMYAQGVKQVPDHFVQLFSDGDRITFVGAISRYRFEQYINGDKKWDFYGRGLAIIGRKNFDANDVFLSYFKNSDKISYTGPVF